MNHHALLSREPAVNRRQRVRVLEACHGDVDLQRGFLQLCREDPLLWINLFVFQYNPTKQDTEVGLFLTWDFQEDAFAELLDAVRTNRTVVLEKSREMGASWLCLLLFLWLFLFFPWKKFLVISRNAKAVDDGDPDSLFWKLRFVLRYLPDWMTTGVTQQQFLFTHANGSSITGEASTGKAGVGGRATAMLIDEFSQIREDSEVRQRTALTTGCRIFNGTHLGLESEFYKLCEQPEIPKIRMHWTQHPEKIQGLYKVENGQVVETDPAYFYPEDFRFVTDNSPLGGPCPGVRSPWYDWKCEQIGNPRGVAMDLDINPTGSVSQFFPPELIRALIRDYALAPTWQGDVEVNERAELARLTEHPLGSLRLWVALDREQHAPKASYGAGADVAQGTGATPSCLAITNGETGEKVLEYSCNTISPERFAAVAACLCRLFADPEGQPAKLAWEHRGPGICFGRRLLELGFQRIHEREPSDIRFFAAKAGGRKIGFDPSDANKMTLMIDYRVALKDRVFLNRSERALVECKQYRYSTDGRKVYHPSEKPKKREVAADSSGVGVNHGDLVVADALSLMMVKGLREPARKPVAKEPAILSLDWRRRWHDRHDREAEVG